MAGGFVRDFYAIAMAADFVEDNAFNAILGEFKNYLSVRLGIKFWEILTLQKNKSHMPEPNSLRMRYSSIHESYSTPLVDKEDKPFGHTSYSYLNNCPLWVLSKDRGPLSSAAEFNEEWNNITDLPPYLDFELNTEKTFTSIIVPIYYNGKIDILNLESELYLSISHEIKSEINQITNALSRILSKYENFKHVCNDTRTAISSLSSILQKEKRYGPIQLFLASSENACPDVMAIIREILDKYSDKIDISFWKTENKSGDINRQIVTELSRSRYGICYFSEPWEGSDGANNYLYKDNLNVMFEAGFMHAQTHSEVEETLAWIPIREHNSPRSPFDIITERAIIVERLSDGALNTDRFRKAFQDRLDDLLQEY